MNPLAEEQLALTRRQLLGRTSKGIGVAALASLLNPALLRDDERDRSPVDSPACRISLPPRSASSISINRAHRRRLTFSITSRSSLSCRERSYLIQFARASASPA